MRCKQCSSSEIIKYGRTKSGVQTFKCMTCGIRFQETYANNSYSIADDEIKTLVKEGCGIRSMSRILKISPTTVLSRIKRITKSISRTSPIPLGKEYEIDELATYITRKKKQIWITYAIRKDTREVIDFAVGRRSLKTMKSVIETIVLSVPQRIFTDKFVNYKILIPTDIHVTRKRCINHIERMNLNLRIHLKRLNRKTLCFSKSMAILIACLRIYFWA